ncbi:hypothetical protein HZH68_016193 [Vespula germanica]|uniref:Uncharacterized protein n=1 Tax=Vespula germanica TaxID=30212 RepID=A0A834MRJ4_VESGE|nr:hypothetical protein HZH68_016193 [Vespula germanica]
MMAHPVNRGRLLGRNGNAYSDCVVWGMNTTYQRTSDKTVGHSFGGCGTGNKPDSALRYIFATFIHHTSREVNTNSSTGGNNFSDRTSLLFINETEFPNAYNINNYLLHLRESTLYHLKGDGRNDLTGNVFPIAKIYCKGSEFSNI